jgi:peptidoglycan-N-acetylglucosamine deacetylase
MKFKIVCAVVFISLIISGAMALIFRIFSISSPIDVLFFVLVFVLVCAILLYAIFEHRASIFGSVFWRGLKDLKAISVTFDDGPNEPYTSQILGVLRKFDIKATFFVLGEKVESFPRALRQEVEGGHEVGLHTYNHKALPLKSPAYIRDQLKRNSELIEKITGITPKLFRPPHGWRNPWTNFVTKRAGFIPVAWTLGVWDTNRPGADEIVRRTLNGLENGCVLLLHDGKDRENEVDLSQLVEALPLILEEAQKRGYRFLTLSQMMNETHRR